jgi:PAS domain-containing protein
MGLTPLDGKRSASPVDEARAALTALEPDEGGQGAPLAVVWFWDLASARVEWDRGLRAILGYAETVTDAAWREARIHPEDRDRVRASLPRVTILNHGASWSGQYRFLRADGSYATVVEHAYVVHDDHGPRGVRGSISLHPKPQLTV